VIFLVLAVVNMFQIVIIVIVIIVVIFHSNSISTISSILFLERTLFWVGILFTVNLSRLMKRTLFTSWHGVTCKRAGTFSSTAVRTSESHTVRFNFTLMPCHRLCNCQLTNSFHGIVCLWPVCVQRNFKYLAQMFL